MSVNKLVSIITINYNNLEGLKKTMRSVVTQTWKEFEYILIDGGSTDGSAEYIESQSDNLNYYISEKDSGIYNAMNKGIKKATGDYLLFLNSGDHLSDNRVLELYHSYLTRQDLIIFDIKIQDHKKSYINSTPNTLRFSDLFYGTVPHQSTFIRKELFERVGLYDEDLKIVSDWKFFILSLFKYDASYKKVDKILSIFYTDGISWNRDFSEERNQVLKQYFEQYCLDYSEMQDCKKELNKAKEILTSNRNKMLIEIEKTFIGKKTLSFFFRIFIIVFSRRRLKDVIDRR